MSTSSQEHPTPTIIIAVELNRTIAGWVDSVEGGGTISDVISEKPGPDHIIHKHLGGVKYDDITITCGTSLSKTFYEWIRATLGHQAARQNGAVITLDNDFKELSRRDWTNGIISEIGFPALDESSNDPARLTIKISPEYVKMTRNSGQPSALISKSPKGTQKRWTPSNFRLNIAGLEDACAHVNSIAPLVIRRQVAQSPIREKQDDERESVNLEIPNLIIAFPESHAGKFYNWHEDFVFSRNNKQRQEKTGTLDFLTSDQQSVLFSLDFMGLGIFKLTLDRVEAGNEGVRRVKAEMYCEQIQLRNEEASIGA